MDLKQYLKLFREAAGQVNKNILREQQIELAVGKVLDSVFLKLYKKSWANSPGDPLTAETRIFFSVWVNEKTLQEQKMYYNIHALKLRKLKGYAIESRKFASVFRAGFERYRNKWPNVAVDLGPLTLMEGWVKTDDEKMPEQVTMLANNFLEIAHLIDEALAQFRKQANK